MRHKSILVLLFALVLFLRANGQEYYDTICWVWVNDPNYYAIEGERFSDKGELNSLFIQSNVCYYEQAYPFAKTLELLKIHEIRCTSGTHIDNVISSLTNRFGNLFYNFSKIEIINDYPMDYDPAEWMWSAHSNDWLWHLKKIKADLAWDITLGDTNVKTAVLDGSIDFTHPDLVTEIYPHFDLYDSVAYSPTYYHGTAVASFVSGETAKPGETPCGKSVSVGFDTKMISYYSICDLNTFLKKALHSSTVMGADVLVSCAGSSLLCIPHPLTGEDLVMKEILNNGTVIVMPAGNGYHNNRSHCNNGIQATEHYPFNSSYDERVIVVTSTDSLDNHHYSVEGVDNTHSHFPTVDICAPGYKVFGAIPVELANDSTFPYYGTLTGTSFAAPIVAGACSLLKSINKDFTPGEIQYFIKSTADPVVDESDYHGMLGAGRLNVFGAVSMANNCSPGIVSSSEYWNRDTTVVCGLEIMQGGCLTISSKVMLSKHSPIIVHQGGKLIIDGGCLTSLDEIQWPGIQVWGDSSADQQIHHGGYYQGYLEMKNGATIENAVCAVNLWHPGYNNSTGGIIRATDAVFRNNATSVRALNYIYLNLNGNEVAYNSQFVKCSFIIDDGYLGAETFSEHVHLENVNSVYFSGCEFSVAPFISGVSYYSRGIAAYGAGFLVESYCENPNMNPSCPENDIVRCTFNGFHNGIRSINDNSNARTFTVKNAIFNNNNRGIFAQNTGFATIVGNEFRIGRNASCGYGVYADGITGFFIEENSFTPTTGMQQPSYGIGIFNSRGVNDVYLNTFNGLTCGNVAYGVNHTADLSGRPPEVKPGLTYSCNENAYNGIDFCVMRDNGFGGIASPQGSSTMPAGNTFSGSQYHIYNDGEFHVKYYYNSNSTYETPVSSKLYHVNTSGVAIANSCTSHYGNGGVVRSAEEKTALANAYQTANTTYTALMDVYKSQIASGVTPTDDIIAEIANSVHDMNMVAGDIVRSCLNEYETDAAELRLWLSNMHDMASDRMAIASYIQEGDFSNALALAATLPNAYNLHGNEMLDHSSYMALIDLYQTLHNSNRSIHDLTTTEVAMVKEMAENGVGVSQQMAKAILMEINDRYVEPYICPDMPRLSGREIATNNGKDDMSEYGSELVVAVMPIPATSWVSIDYKLPDEKSAATMTVINSLGIKLMDVKLEGSSGKKTLDLRNIPNGVYSYIVRCGEHTNTGKIVITK